MRNFGNSRLWTIALVTAACGGGGDATDGGSSTTPVVSDTVPGGTTVDSETATPTSTEGAEGGHTDSAASHTEPGPTSTTAPTSVDPDTTDSSPDPDTSASGTSTSGTTGASMTGMTGMSGTGDETTAPVSGTSGDTSGEPVPASCGDGKVDEGEDCDDGADNGPMGACYADCTANVCGDGNLSPLEECDLGANNGPDSGCSAQCVILPSACGNQAVMAELEPLPVDIVLVIDNSGSMGAEIQGVQNNINVNFAQILESSGLDYRVIVLSKHGQLSAENVCIEAPLSGIPQGGCANPPAQPVNNPGKFYHYSRTISSKDSWCRVLSTATGIQDDDFKFAVDGWQAWLRKESFKTFVELTDDRVQCDSYNDGNTANAGTTAAASFDNALRALLPTQFGATPETRNYRWYSIIGMPYNNPQSKPYGPMDPIVIGKCPDGVNAGPGYQALSNLTGGTKFPLCNTGSYDVVFQAIADGVIDSAKLACEFAVPEAPMGKILDKDSVTVVFTPMGMGVPVDFKKVANLAACADATSFYLEGDKVILCPATCAAIQGDKDANVEVEFTCEPLKPN